MYKRQYLDHTPHDARFLLKAPGLFFAPTRRSSAGGEVRYASNPSYLDAEGFVAQFQEPALELLGDRLAGIVFEQEYQRKESAPEPEAFVEALSVFFEDVPPEVQPHLEIRTPSLLTPAYFGFLEDAGFGHVFSHWQYLPPIREQWQKAGQRFTAADGTAVARLLSPLKMSFEDAFAQAYPFEAPVEALVTSEETQRMVLDAVALAFQAERQQAVLQLIVNNRAYGNAPELARRIAHRVRLTLIRNLNAQLQLLSVGMVAHAARVQLAEDVAAPLNALVAERGLSAEGRATAQRLRRDADTYERFLGTDVSSVSGGLVAGLGRLAGRLHTALLAGSE